MDLVRFYPRQGSESGFGQPGFDLPETRGFRGRLGLGGRIRAQSVGGQDLKKLVQVRTPNPPSAWYPDGLELYVFPGRENRALLNPSAHRARIAAALSCDLGAGQSRFKFGLNGRHG